jgi:hypothetical protein
MSTTSRHSDASSHTRIHTMQDDSPKAAAGQAEESGAASAEPRAADAAVAEKGVQGERDADGVLQENGVEIVGLIGDDDPYS